MPLSDSQGKALHGAPAPARALRAPRVRRRWLRPWRLLPAAALGLALGLFAYIHLLPPDPMGLAQRARPLSAVVVDRAAEGQLVAVTGPLRAEEPLGDPGLLRPGDYIELWREVEVFTWHEDQVGQKTYRYEPRWGPNPPATAEMHQPEGHENPPVRLRSEVLSVPRAWVGAYRFQPSRAWLQARPLQLQPDLLVEPGHRLSDGYLYIGVGTEQAPRLGDVRVRYRVVPAGEVVTLFGEQQGDEIVPAYDLRGARLHHLLPGAHSDALRDLPALLGQRPLLLR